MSAPRDGGINSAFKKKTLNERLEIKESLAGRMRFAEKSVNSNLEIPGYNNPEINGKGFSFNANPNER